MNGCGTAPNLTAKQVWRTAFFSSALIVQLAAGLIDKASAATEPQAAVENTFVYLRDLLPKVCRAARDDLSQVTAAVPGLELLGSAWSTADAPPMRYDWRADRPWGRIHITALTPHGKLRRISVEIWHNSRPQTMALAGANCQLAAARQILYAEDGTPEAVAVFGSNLKQPRSIEPLDAPVPPGEGHAGLRVGLVDTGVAYDQPFIAERLARRPDDSLVGYDYWDDDPRPYDFDSGRSLFLARRHGTLVASVLLAEAPDAALVPYRFPNRNASRMADLVKAADKDDVRILGMPVGSSNKAGWRAFEAAARAHPHLLFIIAAGNYGRDIDQEPVYPASLRLSNALVVTSSTVNGRLGKGANWGARSVDLMVPADRVMARDAYGKHRRVGGTSIAVSRMAALAARLAAANPDWHAAELKAAILARAEPLPKGTGKWVRHGWIPDPQAIGNPP